MFRFINVMISEIGRIVYISPYPIGLPIPSAAGSSTNHLCIIVTSTIVTSPSLSTSATFSSNSNGSGILASIHRTPSRGQRRILRGYRSHTASAKPAPVETIPPFSGAVSVVTAPSLNITIT